MSNFDPYHKWLGIPPAEQPPHHYRLLAIALFESDLEVIEGAADRQMAYIRQCATGPYTKESQKLLNELSAARVCLLNPGKKRAYDAQLKSRVTRIPALQQPVDDLDVDDEFAMLVLERPTGRGNLSLPPRRGRAKRGTRTQPYWIWGGAGALGLLLLWGLVHIITRPSVAPKQATADVPIADNEEEPKRTSENGQTASKPEPPADEPLVAGTTFTNSLGMKLVLVPAGEFRMGSDEDLAPMLKDFPYMAPMQIAQVSHQHPVRITRPFYMGTCEVTLGQFMKFYEAAAYKIEEFKDDSPWGYLPSRKNDGSAKVIPWAPGWDRNNDHPAVYVCWNDADAFCQWLSRQEGKKYRLPTEAEWEYACRAGTTTRYWCGNDPEELVKIANVVDQDCKIRWPNIGVGLSKDGKPTGETIPYPFVSGRDGYVLTAPVGDFPANPFGLCDMHGNVFEWCQDWYIGTYYKESPVDDPPGPASGLKRVMRGGGWRSVAALARSAARVYVSPEHRSNELGFRVVCETGVAAAPATTAPPIPSVTAVPSSKLPVPALPPNATPREIVERVLQLKGEVVIQTGDAVRWKTIKGIDELPEGGTVQIRNLVLQSIAIEDLQSICRLAIENLRLSQNGVTNDHLAVLGKAKGIHSLSLHSTSCTEDGLVSLSGCPNLDAVTLTQCDFTAAGWKHFGQIPKLSKLMATAGDVSDAHVESLAGHPGLKYLAIEDGKVTGAGFRTFRGLPQLGGLKLVNCPVDAAGIQAIGTGLPELRAFECRSVTLTDEGLKELRNLKGLLRLWIDSPNITDAALEIAADLGSLQNLRLDGAPVTGAGFRGQKGKWSKLTHCFFEKCPLTDEGLQNLADAAPQIQHLTLFSSAVTDKGLVHLSKFKSLQTLGLNGSPITDAGLKQLEGLRGLIHLSLSNGRFAPAPLEALRKALPKCGVYTQ